jgi:hypothetical protein
VLAEQVRSCQSDNCCALSVCLCWFCADGLGRSECVSVLEIIHAVLQRVAVLLSTPDAGGKSEVQCFQVWDVQLCVSVCACIDCNA